MAFEKRWKYPTKTGGTRHDRELSIYSIWYKMVRRCTNPKDNVYDRYGGRGITVCEAWLSYDRFFEWAMSAGYSEGLTIDRIDNDQGYFPANCRWADRKVQARNTSRNVYVGDECVAQIAERVGMPYSTVYERYKRGYISDEELAAPVNTLNATRRVDGKTLSQIAEESGVSVNTVRERWKRGDRTYERLARKVPVVSK